MGCEYSWYRPTRICHVVSGAEFGWRNGSGKWPVYYPDSVPPVVNVGPGSPTGVCFGYGTKFPSKYQNALFACDWSYGKLYAVHLHPDGSTYSGELEEFVAGTPLPLTDVVVGAQDAHCTSQLEGGGRNPDFIELPIRGKLIPHLMRLQAKNWL